MLQLNRQEWESNLKAGGWIQIDGWWSHPEAPGIHNIVSAMDLLLNSEKCANRCA
jgi:hypothetical protein